MSGQQTCGGTCTSDREDGFMAKRKAPAPASSAKATPAKARSTQAKAAKAALAARQPDLLDLLTEKPKVTRTRAKREKPTPKGEQ
jgi:hypothetical protein